MILQALKEYYDRKAADQNSGIAPLGWEWKEIPFLVVIDSDGKLVNIEDTRQLVGKKKRAKAFLVPKGVKRTVGIAPNTLWDNVEYALGVPVKSTSKKERVEESHREFLKRLDAFAEVDCVAAVIKFLQKCDVREQLAQDTLWTEVLESGAFISFRIVGADSPITGDAVFRELYDLKSNESDRNGKMLCLVSGVKDSLALTHPSVKGVWGSNTTGGNIVSFNFASACSYGRQQGENAPVGERAAFAYTTALNTLLGKDSRQKMSVGDATVVFWTSKDSSFEDKFADVFSDPPKDDPDRLTNNVASLLSSVKTGAYQESDDPTRFHVLGLAPNSARISVRFWHVGTVAEMSTRFAEWFEDLMIVHDEWKYRDAKDHLPMSALLKAVAPPSRDKAKGPLANLPPNLAGNTMRSILEGLPLPETLLQAALRRIKAEKGEVPYPRAKLIKACLNRKIKFIHSKDRMLTVALDKENTNIGYRLGRLFATLERIQCKAMGWDKPGEDGKHSTIRDKYFASASSTPCAVFGTIIRLSNHHLDKIENPKSKTYFNKLIGEITYQDHDKTGIVKFPAHLKLEDQAQFALGYYHQRQDFFSGNGMKAISPESNEQQSDLFNQNN